MSSLFFFFQIKMIQETDQKKSKVEWSSYFHSAWNALKRWPGGYRSARWDQQHDAKAFVIDDSEPKTSQYWLDRIITAEIRARQYKVWLDKIDDDCPDAVLWITLNSSNHQASPAVECVCVWWRGKIDTTTTTSRRVVGKHLRARVERPIPHWILFSLYPV